MNSRFDDNTTQLFKALKNDTNGFNEACLHNVRVVAELSSVSSRYPSAQSYHDYSSYLTSGGRKNKDRPALEAGALVIS